jgi:hypothetical protein
MLERPGIVYSTISNNACLHRCDRYCNLNHYTLTKSTDLYVYLHQALPAGEDILVERNNQKIILLLG